MPILTKEKRKVYLRKIKGFWEEYTKSKMGLLGLGMLIIFGLTATLSSVIAPYDPGTVGLAENWAVPEWTTHLVPDWRNLPRSTHVYYNLVLAQPNPYVEINPGVYEGKYPCCNITYRGNKSTNAEVVLAEFNYQYDPLSEFLLEFGLVMDKCHSARYDAKIELITPSGERHDIWKKLEWLDSMSSVTVSPYDIQPLYTRNMTRYWFSEKGTYQLLMSLDFTSLADDAFCQLSFLKSYAGSYSFFILGKAWGILGANYNGGDCFSEFILGIRISMIIGLLAAGIATTIGVMVGIFAGYLGGLVDESIMRFVDALMCIPILPILMLLTIMFGRSLWYILLIIGVFWWLGLSRMIRSQVLSIREMPFIECALASGGSRLYTMVKHILPNVMPLALSDFVLTVPAAIMFEAGLSFIGYGDPTYATWGRMLQRAQIFGAFDNMSWWFFLPPGLGIIFVCLTFVFIGQAVDQIVNPRLRERR